ncbi:MAG: phosphate acyltransferase PlsX [Clostridiales bacterium]|nr:phosphate acyltransferase PlsX [Clostridiales bacterium]
MLKIVVDAMGGDNAPVEIVKGAIQALDERKNFAVVLTGDEGMIRTELAKYKYDKSRVEIVHCSEVITNDDVPTSAVRSKKDSSLVVGMRMLKENDEVGGFVSAGSTGAVLTGGIMLIGRIKGVMRPALCPGIPNVRGTRTLLCDCGANAECKPQYLAQFGIMASAYAKAAFGVKSPRVGLLTNGTEEHKGDPLHQEAHQLLKQTSCIDFVGNIEGRDIMYGDVDIAVSDGFSGNIALKSIEGCGKTVSTVLSNEFRASLGSKISYLFARKQLKKLKLMLDYARLGGSVFLGLKKVVIKTHGSSKAKSICPSVVQAVDAYNNHLVETIEEMLGKVELSGAQENA